MSNRYEARAKGYVAYKLDTEAMKPLAIEYLKTVYGTAPTDELRVEPLLILRTKKQSEEGMNLYATVCSEGVGWFQDDDRLISIPLSTSEWLWMNVNMKLHPRVVADYITEEQVDLADWVRVFGNRLEMNLSIWQGQIEGIEQDFHDIKVWKEVE